MLVIASLPMLNPSLVAQADKVRVFNPAIANVELSTREPKPADIVPIVNYGGWGGGGFSRGSESAGVLIQLDNKSDPVYWQTYYPVLGNLLGPSILTACSTRTLNVEQGLLQTPSGKTLKLSEWSHASPSNNCHDYPVEWAPGMELGLYTLTLTTPAGSISTTWGIDDPFCPIENAVNNAQRAAFLNENPDHPWTELLLGYLPQEVVTLNFYADGTEQHGPATFLATRQVQLSKEGAALITIHISRSLLIKRDNITFTVSRLNPALPAPVESGDYSADGIPCSGNLIPRFVDFHPDRQYQVMVHTAPEKSLTLYMHPNDLSSQFAALDDKTAVNVLEQRPLITDGRVMPWYHVKSSSGQEGWVYGPHLAVPKEVVHSVQDGKQMTDSDAQALLNAMQHCENSPVQRLKIGQTAKVTPPLANTLRVSPDGVAITSIPVGSLVKVIDGPACSLEGRTYWKCLLTGQSAGLPKVPPKNTGWSQSPIRFYEPSGSSQYELPVPSPVQPMVSA